MVLIEGRFVYRQLQVLTSKKEMSSSLDGGLGSIRDVVKTNVFVSKKCSFLLW